ncbi:MAG: hypothetical protein AB1847_15165 [bacterium]
MAIKRLNLSLDEKVCRSLYEVLRDGLDRDLIQYALVDSFKNFQSRNQPYPFVEKRELNPKVQAPEREYKYQNSLLAIFYEGVIPSEYKKYIRFLSSNKVSKINLSAHLLDLNIDEDFYPNIKYFGNYQFDRLFHSLLPVDYALLLQKDPSIESKNRYLLSHFHVKIDWPVASAAEDMGKRLHYLSGDIYERGEEYAELLQHKLFEYYGFPHFIGGRRTAAVVAAQFSRRMDFLSTIYVASASSRTLTKISGNELYRYLLIKLSSDEMISIARANHMEFDIFREKFTIHSEKDYGVAILLIVYEHTTHSTPQKGGRVRLLNPDSRWLTIACQLLIPQPMAVETRPIRHSEIY